jgi:cytochrome c oxidase assembly protein subunit 15
MLEHRVAKLAAVATFLLLLIGSIVNPTGSSLACPEPTLLCHKQLFPPMVGGVLYEHGHRLAAMTVGLLQIALTVLLQRRRPGLRRLGWILHGLVIAQGTFGAITVGLNLKWYISTAHLLLGLSYFATLIYASFRTRPEPSVLEIDRRERRIAELGPARRWIAVACGAVFLQILLGALVRHLGAATACLGMPSCTPAGDWWPADDPLHIQHLHMIHRGVGVIVAIVTVIAAIQVARHSRSWPALRVLAFVAPALVIGQIVLGIYTVLTVRAVPLAVAHFAGAASLWTLWMSAFLLTRARRPVATIARADDASAMQLVEA